MRRDGADSSRGSQQPSEVGETAQPATPDAPFPAVPGGRVAGGAYLEGPMGVAPEAPSSALRPLPPTPGTERIVTIDALRGIAILGILLMNIRSFALPSAGYFSPLAMGPIPAGDYAAFLATHILAEGKFISIFAMLFGAGLLLSSRRHEETGRAAAVQYRRLAILAVVGILHMTLIWYGDILFAYAILGMLVFPLRKLPVAWLVGLAATGFVLTIALWVGMAGMMEFAVRTASPEGARQIIEEFRMEADPEETAAFLSGFLTQIPMRLKLAGGMLMAMFMAFPFWLAGLMLLGMALLRTGVLAGEAAGAVYRRGGMILLPVGLAISVLSALLGHQLEWQGVIAFFVGGALHMAGALCVALGLICVIIPVMRYLGELAATRVGLAAGVAAGVVGALAATGRMAFTNYLLQSVLCTFIFYGHGLGYFGQVGYLPQLGVVLGVWVVCVTLSVLWLSRFRFGPMEWAWRRMTYGRAVA